MAPEDRHLLVGLQDGKLLIVTSDLGVEAIPASPPSVPPRVFKDVKKLFSRDP